jgi:hypothetical protein
MASVRGDAAQQAFDVYLCYELSVCDEQEMGVQI